MSPKPPWRSSRPRSKAARRIRRNAARQAIRWSATSAGTRLPIRTQIIPICVTRQSRCAIRAVYNRGSVYGCCRATSHAKRPGSRYAVRSEPLLRSAATMLGSLAARPSSSLPTLVQRTLIAAEECAFGWRGCGGSVFSGLAVSRSAVHNLRAERSSSRADEIRALWNGRVLTGSLQQSGDGVRLSRAIWTAACRCEYPDLC